MARLFSLILRETTSHLRCISRDIWPSGGELFVWPKSQAYQNRPHPISNHLLSLDKTRILSFEAQKRLIMTYSKILFSSAQHCIGGGRRVAIQGMKVTKTAEKDNLVWNVVRFPNPLALGHPHTCQLGSPTNEMLPSTNFPGDTFSPFLSTLDNFERLWTRLPPPDLDLLSLCTFRF